MPRRVFTIVLLLWSAAGTAAPEDTGSGALLLNGAAGRVSAPALRAAYEARVTGLIARTTVTQEFRNPADEWVEGIYVFPLPENAAVDRLRMTIGKRVIEGQIRERQQAKREYAAARDTGRRASLVEQERPNIFTTSVANIGPFDTIVVEIEYQQTLRYVDGSFSFRLPLVVGPRYVPGTQRVAGFSGSGWGVNTDAVPDAERITPPVAPSPAEPLNPVSIAIELDAGLPVENVRSAYHAIVTRISDAGVHRITLRDSTVPASRDFVLNWDIAAARRPRAALFSETHDGRDYAMLMLMPPPAAPADATLPREIIVVIDTSGSMAGTSIRQAKAAVETALARLRPWDSFNVIRFASGHDALFENPMPASADTVARARRWVARLDAGGGTEMAGALQRALGMSSPTGADVSQVIFITDGAVGNEAALLALLRQRLGKRRLFTVGIGAAPNSYFMTEAARFGRGTFTYVGHVDEASTALSELFERIETPVLTDIAISWPDGVSRDVLPARLPDLFAGEPLLIALRGTLPAALTVTGRRRDAPWHETVPLAPPDPASTGNGVATHWARTRIADLMRQRHRRDESDPVYRAILDTALTHHQVSPYTSLLAVDVTPARVREESLATRALATNLPAGWQADAVFGRLPGTATPLRLELLLAGAALLMALGVEGVRRRVR